MDTAAARRIAVVKQHISPAAVSAQQHISLGSPLTDPRPPGADVMESVARSVEDRCTTDLTKILPGPLDDPLLADVADPRERKARRDSAEHFFQIERAALHSYGPGFPDSHSR